MEMGQYNRRAICYEYICALTLLMLSIDAYQKANKKENNGMFFSLGHQEFKKWKRFIKSNPPSN